MLQIGAKQAAVTRTLNVSQWVIWARDCQTHTVDDRRRSGRPRAITAPQDCFICMSSASRNRAQSATQIRHQLYTATGVRDHFTQLQV